ncbi:MAG: hypothetical protein AAF790_07660 [Planctomycetota bacterium]
MRLTHEVAHEVAHEAARVPPCDRPGDRAGNAVAGESAALRDHAPQFDAAELPLSTLGDGAQINVPPNRRGGLWKVISAAIRCPECGSARSKASTGKRINSEGLCEHYRVCSRCGLRFRVVQE